MSEVTWIVQPREVETEGRPHGSLQLPHKGSRGAGTDLFSLVTATGPKAMHGAAIGELQVGLLGNPVQSQELDSIILVGPFQFRIFCDSVIRGNYIGDE